MSSAYAKEGYVRLNLDENDDSEPISPSTNPYLQQQQKAIDKQDQSLGRISSSLRTLKNMSHQIGEELEDQSEMLDELGNSMSGVESRMDEVMKKLSKLTRLENESNQWMTIFILIGLIVILLLLLVLL
ncbi:t-SNARE coiled-coil homology domain-containing protein [Meloidogyne graminicola]|uniref:t-SNARE coiled-coil homology domain-containing protein n=1 Tax=Meloidogyne graminicola TaxID=189291 RepID=A0A8S9ZDM5_9BILA|nr:t-SNARE coiled-coil homology domain-containing protein [Meloidogyne graminicola]